MTALEKTRKLEVTDRLKHMHKPHMKKYYGNELQRFRR